MCAHHTRTHARTQTRMQTHMHMHTHKHVHMCTHRHPYTCAHVHTETHVHTDTCKHTYAHRETRMHTCTRMQTRTQFDLAVGSDPSPAQPAGAATRIPEALRPPHCTAQTWHQADSCAFPTPGSFRLQHRAAAAPTPPAAERSNAHCAGEERGAGSRALCGVSLQLPLFLSVAGKPQERRVPSGCFLVYVLVKRNCSHL